MSKTERLDIHNSEIPLVCRSCEARHRGICGALPPDELVFLSKHTSKHDFDSGQELVPAGEETATYSNILSGVVRLSKLMADGRQQIVGLQFAPDFMGRPFRKSSEVNVDAATGVRVCSFPRSVLEEIIGRVPALEHRLHEQTLKELDEARDWMLTLGRKSAEEKVASFLHLIAAHIDPEREDGPVEFELPLRRADIADFLGLTIETVSRQLTRLRKRGVIEIRNNRTVTVPDLAELSEICETDRDG